MTNMITQEEREATFLYEKREYVENSRIEYL